MGDGDGEQHKARASHQWLKNVCLLIRLKTQ